MNGFEYDKDDPYSTVSTKTLRNRLRSNLSELQPTMQQKIKAFLKQEVCQEKLVHGIYVLSTVAFPMWYKTLKMIRLEEHENISYGDTINCHSQRFFSCRRTSWYVLLDRKATHDNDKILIASNPDYFEAASQYSYDAGIATEILRFTPAFLHPFVIHLDGRRDMSS